MKVILNKLVRYYIKYSGVEKRSNDFIKRMNILEPILYSLLLGIYCEACRSKRTPLIAKCLPDFQNIQPENINGHKIE